MKSYNLLHLLISLFYLLLYLPIPISAPIQFIESGADIGDVVG